MKKITAMLLAGAMLLSLAACGGKPAGSNPGGGSNAGGGSSAPQTSGVDYSALEKVTLNGGDTAGKGAAGQLFGELVAEKLDAITGGQLTLEYFPNGELGADADLLRQVKANELQIVVCQTAPVVSFVSEVAVFDLPMVFAKYDGATIDKVLNGDDSAFKADLGKAFNNNGFELLGILQNATYRLTTAKKNLETLADFKGLQIRTMENQNHMAFWRALGAEPTPMPWNEVYFALQSGNIGAQENAADTCVGNNLNEVQDYLAFTNHILYANMMIINQDAYNSLDPLYQQALQQAVREAISEIGAKLATIDAENKAELKSRGMTLIEYAPEFYDEVLAVPGVVDLYKQIDDSIGGLGATLQNSLEEAAAG